MAELAGRQPASSYLGAADLLVDAALDRARRYRKDGLVSTPRLVGTDFGGPAGAPLLLLGPSLGTSADTLWARAALHLRADLRVVGWDLPGHGRSPSGDPFTIAELAAGVLALADRLGAETFHYAGDSVGGCVGLQLLLDAPHRVATATLLCTGARIGTPDGVARARRRRAHRAASAAVLDGAAERWFGRGFAAAAADHRRGPARRAARHRPECYAQTCEALAAFDVTDRLADIATPVLAIAGADDVPTPPESLRRIASGVKDGGWRCSTASDTWPRPKRPRGSPT